MSLITKLLDVYNGVNPPDVVKDVWFNLPNTATTNDVALVLKTQGERYEVRQYVTGYYVWDGTEWIYELDAIARVSESAGGGGAIKFVNANYTANVGEDIYADASLGAFTITLPDASLNSGAEIEITKVDSTNNRVTIKAIASTISTEAEVDLRKQAESFRIESNGVNWWIK